MHTLSELQPLLKSLRLSGIAEYLPQRNQEAIASKMGFMDFLSMVLQDEILRREQNKFDSLFKKSGVKGNKTLEKFNFSFNPKINQQQIKEVAHGRFIDEKVSVLIVGPCGTGKSHLAQAMGHCALRRGIPSLFLTQTQLITMLQTSKIVGNYDKKMRALVKIPLLIIDDFGLKPLRSPQDEDFHELIAQRYEEAATIITSNLDFSEWGDAFPNKLLGAATLDRLGHAAYKIILEGRSFRAENSSNRKKNEGVEFEGKSTI